MPKDKRIKRLSFFTGCVSWVLLLVNVLFLARQRHEGEANLAEPYLNNLLSVIFILSVFLYQRYRVHAQRTAEFTAPLQAVLLKGGAGAYLTALLFFGYPSIQEMGTNNVFLLDAFYQVLFGFLVYFLAKAFYTWRQFILYQKTKDLMTQWKWFEILVALSLLVPLLNVEYMKHIFLILDLGLLLAYGLYLSVNLRWVAFLSLDKKWLSIFLLAAILLSIVLFSHFLFQYSDSPELVVDYTDNPFILITLAFVFCYTLSSLLVALFSLPTSRVFEQKNADLLSFQRLTQSIQQGQNEEEVYALLFESVIKASGADAAWLEYGEDAKPSARRHNESAPDPLVQDIKRALAQSGKDKQADWNHIFINNDLRHSSTFKDLQLPFHSLLVMPLASNKRRYGHLYLLREVEQGFDQDTINVVQSFTNQTVLTIENLRLLEESLQNERYKEELKIASLVQDRLIPKTFPTDTWFEISSYSQAAKEVGGDFYDFLQLSESRIAIIIGDVSGKGISAAFHMAQMKGIFHGLMQQDLLPDEFMVQANSALSRCLERTSFITSALYIIDYKMQGVSFARAGHCHTLYYNAMMEDTFYFQTEGLGLGIIRDASYAKRIHRLHYDYNPGDVMVIYTDGIIEARSEDQEEYGEDRLKYMLSQTYHLEAEDIKSAIMNDVTDFTNDTLHDDQTLLVIKFKPRQPNT
ncbi:MULTISPECIES: PP2C family protein-serine/threonine phosphatase [Rufibacter]|uniref:Serine phosphatase RsbU (Regulator of sigma subunit) n=1 Tax=Rufibacter quisquiliarum TaxID=1549639 RepID=A0A839H1A5_9BACT|nr:MULTISPECIES: GAF domain-containing SpoIIE family protein phosphatase [Rufibacter]MBA9079681.1 serine phosphatase RsbU (regulator of sigma subunit) [Rufibacter quisquiliarum]